MTTPTVSDIEDMLNMGVKDVVFDALTMLQDNRSLHTPAVHTKLNDMIRDDIMSNAIIEYLKDRR